MIGRIRKIVHARRERANRLQVTRLGQGSQLPGSIERRASEAEINIGSGCLIQGQLVAERSESRINLADNVLVGGGTVIDCALSITVERNVLISYACILADSDNHSLYPELRVDDLPSWMDGRRNNWSVAAMAPILICEGAWIGARSIILKGVTVGAGAVVGMGSVVTADVPPRTVVAGNPARVIRDIGPPPGGQQ
jgi:acetyltransferase-like isoleucine patch superfamily enzyme